MSASPLVEYARFLPIPVATHLVSLGEGRTPLVRSEWFAHRLGIADLYFKFEQTNPSGSYKDRFAAYQVSLMRARGQTACVATSSGNTGAALAAYCARAGIRCSIFLTENTPVGKLTQMLAYGAELLRVRGFGASAESTAEVFRTLAQLSVRSGIPLVISAYQYCREGMEGVKTISHEIADQLAILPSDVVVPVGAGGLCTAVTRGFADCLSEGVRRGARPRVHAVQPLGNDTMVSPWREGHDQARMVQSTTRISGLPVPMDVDGTRALAAVRSTEGVGILVDDEYVWEVQRDLCRHEGIFVEPAGAVAVAGLVRAVSDDTLRPQGPTVCILTGHGFKDPASAERMASDAPTPLVDADDIESVVLG